MAFLIYILKSALILAVFYFCWRLLLGRETLHRANRITLLSIVTGAFLLPLPLFSIHNPAAAEPSFIALPAQNTWRLPEVNPSTAIAPSRILTAVYIAGAVAALLWSIMSIVHILRMKRMGRLQTMKDGTLAVITDKAAIPFSWMRWIFISEEDWARQSESILCHEKAHLNLHHSYDVLFMGLAVALQWFNPAMWLLRRDLLLVHEYEADAMVLKSGLDAGHYQRLMLGRAVGRDLNAVTNSFSHSAVRARIDMMLKKSSAKGAGCKALAFIPLILACLFLSANTEPSYTSEPERAGTEFEQNFIKSRAGSFAGSDAVWLVGYRTAVYHGEDSIAVMEVWRQNREEIEKEGNVFLMPGAARFYFALANAIVECDGKRYAADDNGVVTGLKMHAGKEIALIGRAASEHGKATEFGTAKQAQSTYRGYNTVVFDIGELFN